MERAYFFFYLLLLLTSPWPSFLSRGGDGDEGPDGSRAVTCRCEPSGSWSVLGAGASVTSLPEGGGDSDQQTEAFELSVVSEEGDRQEAKIVEQSAGDVKDERDIEEEGAGGSAVSSDFTLVPLKQSDGDAGRTAGRLAGRGEVSQVLSGSTVSGVSPLLEQGVQNEHEAAESRRGSAHRREVNGRKQTSRGMVPRQPTKVRKKTNAGRDSKRRRKRYRNVRVSQPQGSHSANRKTVRDKKKQKVSERRDGLGDGSSHDSPERRTEEVSESSDDAKSREDEEVGETTDSSTRERYTRRKDSKRATGRQGRRNPRPRRENANGRSPGIASSSDREEDQDGDMTGVHDEPSTTATTTDIEASVSDDRHAAASTSVSGFPRHTRKRDLRSLPSEVPRHGRRDGRSSLRPGRKKSVRHSGEASLSPFASNRAKTQAEDGEETSMEAASPVERLVPRLKDDRRRRFSIEEEEIPSRAEELERDIDDGVQAFLDQVRAFDPEPAGLKRGLTFLLLALSLLTSTSVSDAVAFMTGGAEQLEEGRDARLGMVFFALVVLGVRFLRKFLARRGRRQSFRTNVSLAHALYKRKVNAVLTERSTEKDTRRAKHLTVSKEEATRKEKPKTNTADATRLEDESRPLESEGVVSRRRKRSRNDEEIEAVQERRTAKRKARDRSMPYRADLSTTVHEDTEEEDEQEVGNRISYKARNKALLVNSHTGNGGNRRKHKKRAKRKRASKRRRNSFSKENSSQSEVSSEDEIAALEPTSSFASLPLPSIPSSISSVGSSSVETSSVEDQEVRLRQPREDLTTPENSPEEEPSVFRAPPLTEETWPPQAGGEESRGAPSAIQAAKRVLPSRRSSRPQSVRRQAERESNHFPNMSDMQEESHDAKDERSFVGESAHVLERSPTGEHSGRQKTRDPATTRRDARSVTGASVAAQEEHRQRELPTQQLKPRRFHVSGRHREGESTTSPRGDRLPAGYSMEQNGVSRRATDRTPFETAGGETSQTVGWQRTRHETREKADHVLAATLRSGPRKRLETHPTVRSPSSATDRRRVWRRKKRARKRQHEDSSLSGDVSDPRAVAGEEKHGEATEEEASDAGADRTTDHKMGVVTPEEVPDVPGRSDEDSLRGIPHRWKVPFRLQLAKAEFVEQVHEAVARRDLYPLKGLAGVLASVSALLFAIVCVGSRRFEDERQVVTEPAVLLIFLTTLILSTIRLRRSLRKREAQNALLERRRQEKAQRLMEKHAAHNFDRLPPQRNHSRESVGPHGSERNLPIKKLSAEQQAETGEVSPLGTEEKGRHFYWLFGRERHRVNSEEALRQGGGSSLENGTQGDGTDDEKKGRTSPKAGKWRKKLIARLRRNYKKNSEALGVSAQISTDIRGAAEQSVGEQHEDEAEPVNVVRPGSPSAKSPT
ncbi:retinitis pigmentosa gtpase regulator [Cystoisospora suis]|uniref:Retinitis pigmentosa gtpase regulator n=1 Tax=Cystoisospora suis TaxID=483139 RepID=A0A2C6K4W6_9APIC|nr:retinitis pigmentosa gtpase regulator [Cystoisospora suis]